MENVSNKDELVFLSKKILELNKRLIESESAKSSFLSLVVSELNNPMTAFLGMIPHLKIEESEENRKHFNLIFNEALKLHFRIQNLVMTAEIESGHINITYALFGLQKVIDEVTESLKYIINENNIQINIVNSIEEKISTDPKIVYMIVKNLISNGCKYGIENGVVDVNLDKDESKLIIQVRNQGDGPKVNYMPEVFTRFAKNTEGDHGLGLGLSIVRELCERLDGGVDYIVKDGYVTFTATLLLDDALVNSQAYGADEFLFESFDDAVEL